MHISEKQFDNWGKRSETFQFTNLEQLRDFLNAFTQTDLSVVLPDGSYIELDWIENKMSDGSEPTIDVRLRTA